MCGIDFHWCNLNKIKQVVPCVLRKRAFGKYVRCLFSGLDKSHLDMIMPRNLFHDKGEIDSMCAGDMAHRRSALFKTHFDDSIIVLKNDEFGPSRR